MQRRNLVLAEAAFAAGTTRAQQHSGPHHTLPVAPSSPDPYAKLQGGVPHHMTPEQESQRVTDSPASAGPRGRWVARAALPIPRSEALALNRPCRRIDLVRLRGESHVPVIAELLPDFQ